MCELSSSHRYSCRDCARPKTDAELSARRHFTTEVDARQILLICVRSKHGNALRLSPPLNACAFAGIK
jgi:hypothetical protein